MTYNITLKYEKYKILISLPSANTHVFFWLFGLPYFYLLCLVHSCVSMDINAHIVD